LAGLKSAQAIGWQESFTVIRTCVAHSNADGVAKQPSASLAVCASDATDNKPTSIAMSQQVQYVSDEQGELQSVIVPIGLWREFASEQETSYLLESEAMRKRLAEARARDDGMPAEDAFEKLGV
jgi:hypothetical protein